MQLPPYLSLPRLRGIAAREWDVSRAIESDRDRSDIDRLLIEAAGRLWSGASDSDVADYFTSAATEMLGIDAGDDIRERALVLTTAIRDYLQTLPAKSGPLMTIGSSRKRLLVAAASLPDYFSLESGPPTETVGSAR